MISGKFFFLDWGQWIETTGGNERYRSCRGLVLRQFIEVEVTKRSIFSFFEKSIKDILLLELTSDRKKNPYFFVHFYCCNNLIDCLNYIKGKVQEPLQPPNFLNLMLVKAREN